tara:strand:+ start:966 stop:1268 length:303 start_codon:yes stop_codon:yes gene_type:complete
MGKAIGIGAVLFVVLSLGTWALLTNAHIDIFPCTTYPGYEAPCGAPQSGMCSMMAIYRDEPCSPELGGGGYGVALLVMIFLPAIVAGLVARKFRGPRPAA